ncbi:AAA family ATPase [Sphingomonas sp. ZB1N12]|uniref:TrlF family AAA-like ATPase n=1 Tax=Sphingomonas arabinosi TaxID=3096160 RepID=UPI002FC6434F
MTYAKGMHPGAVWKRTDLQIHTPRDAQWQGSPNLAGGTAELEAVRADWADRFVQQCLDGKFGAIALTDHHDACFTPYVREAIERAGAGDLLWLFPGMEVTCGDSSQCLILFDSGTPPATVGRLYGGHLNVAEPDNNAAKAPQTVPCGKDLREFLASIASDSLIAAAAIVLPNGSDGGHKTIIRQGFAPRFANLPFDGVYTDHRFDRLGDSAKRKLYGETIEWGTRRRGVIPTGDNRQNDFGRLGVHDCWMRLGEPSAEAIRQAVLADEARIAYEQPALPSQRILEIRVSSSLTGPHFAMSFNDGFNALIGGRGSGKSAILEYLRFGLGRSSADVVTGEDSYRERDQELISQTLADGEVVITLERDGVRETWRRSGASRETITVDGDNGQIQLTVADAQQRFRARAFYQRQLSSIVLDRGRTAEQITGIAAAEFADQRRLIERDIESAKRDVASAYQKAVEFWVAEAELSANSAAASDLRLRIEAVRSRLNEAGLSAGHRDLLDSAPDYALASRLIEEARQHLVNDLVQLRRARDHLKSLDMEPWQPLLHRFVGLSSVVTFGSETKAKVEAALALAIDAVQEFDLVQNVQFDAVEQQTHEFFHEHAVAIELQEHVRSIIDEAQRLAIELQSTLAAERRSVVRIDGLRHAITGLGAARFALAEKISEFSEMLRTAAVRVVEMSNGALRGSVMLEGSPKQYQHAILTICEGSRIRDLPARCEDRVAEIAANGTENSWTILVDAILKVRQHQLQTDAKTVGATEPTGQLICGHLFGELTAQQLNGIYSRIDDSAIVRMLTATATPFIAFEYRDAGRYIPFGQASPGQQASALLQLLLTQEAGTLIIDQPEDDLDNRVVMEIARLLQRTKRRRQLVFATHNPNFVVNGDADKIVALKAGSVDQDSEVESNRIAIDVDGAIETPSVRDAVTETMEGGQAAFELRGRKYSF